MDNFLIGIVLGVLIGVVANLVSWWILFYGIAPTLHFSAHVGKTRRKPTEEDKSSYRYRIKVENAGRRAVIDVEFMVRLRIKGLYSKTQWHVVYIPLASDGRLTWRIPRILPARRRGKRSSHTLWLWVNSADEFSKEAFYPEELRNKAKNKNLSLEEVLNLGSAATLEIEAFGYDGLSGARKIFLSKRYTTADIREGKFKGLDIPVKPSALEADEELIHNIDEDE